MMNGEHGPVRTFEVPLLIFWQLTGVMALTSAGAGESLAGLCGAWPCHKTKTVK